MYYLSRRDNETRIKVDEQYSNENTVVAEYLNGDKQGKTVSITHSTLKRWWKKIDEVTEESKSIPTAKIKKSEVSKKESPSTDKIKNIKSIEDMLRKTFDVKTYDSMKNYFVLRKKGEKKAFAEVRCGKRIQVAVKKVTKYIEENTQYKEGYKYFLPVHIWLDYSPDINDIILKLLE